MISVITPTYNERENIEIFIKRVSSCLISAGQEFEIIIVDDNSPDGTAEVVVSLKSQFPQVSLIRRSYRKGIGSAYFDGFLAAKGSFLVGIDADLSLSSKSILLLVHELNKGIDMVIGSRYLPSSQIISVSWSKRIGSRLFNLFSKKILNINLSDITHSFRGFRKEVFDNISKYITETDHPSFFIECTFWANKEGYKIKEVPIIFRERRFGQSKLNILQGLEKGIETLFRLKKLSNIKTSQRVCIIGGGITGNAFAWFLSKKASDKITIIEKELVIGGLAKAIGTKFGFEIENFYHFLYRSDAGDTIGFMKDLGLKPKIIWGNVKSAVFIKNTLFSVDDISSLLKVRLLSFKDKIRLLTAMLRVVFINFKNLDNIPSEKYLVSLFGKNNYRLIWEPLMFSKFTEYAKKVPASWIARRIQVTFFSRSWIGKTRYGYVKGSYNPVFRKLNLLLRKKKVEILSDQVLSVEQIKNKVKVITQNSGVFWYDKVVIATPVSVAKNILVNKDAKDQLKKYKELNAFAVLLFLKNKFSDYFWINVNEQSTPFTGIIEMTNLTGTKIFKGINIVYLVQYLSDKSSFNREDFLENMINHLKQINPNFNEADIIEQFSSFATGVAPVPFMDYLNNMPPFQSKQSKIFLLNSSMIYPQDRGVGNSIKLAEKNVDEFIKV